MTSSVRARSPNRAYLDVRDPKAFADAFAGRFLANGGKAQTLRGVVQDAMAQQQQFFLLMRTYLALGLVVGIAGIGVIMVRAVRERRRQVGVLRALGFQAAAVRAAFVVESAFVAVEGVLIGTVLALVCAWSITLDRRVRRRARVPHPVRRDRAARRRHVRVRAARDGRAGPIGGAHPARGRPQTLRLR